MKLKVFVFLIISSFIFQVIYSECPRNEKMIVCYYASWSVYRNSTGQFVVDDIDPNLCTHLIYTFSGLNQDGKIDTLDMENDVKNGGFARFNSLKSINPCLKTLLAIGGWNEGSQKYSVMASTFESRLEFVESVLRFVATYGFDGFDFDWEYPTQRGGIPEDKQNFAELLKMLKERLSIWNLLLTVAVPISSGIVEESYDLLAIRDYVDYVFLMAYDSTPVDSNITGLISPMQEVENSVNFWLSAIPPNKLILGVPTYARTYNLLNVNDFEIGAPTDGLGIAGEYTLERGFLSYYELKSKLLSERYTEVKNDNNYYAYYENEWFTYDKEDTYSYKAEYALNKSLGGMMVWSIDTDDFRGIYDDAYPILKTIRATVCSSIDKFCY